MKKLITRETDYTGCDPEIAAALKQGLEVRCRSGDASLDPVYVYAYIKKHSFPYRSVTDDENVCTNGHVKPVPIYQKEKANYLKKASEIFRIIEEVEGGIRLSKGNKTLSYKGCSWSIEAIVGMAETRALVVHSWPFEWLEEREVE